MKSAPPIAPPGCPDLAFSTIDAASIRMLSAARFIIALSVIGKIFVIVCYKVTLFSSNGQFFLSFFIVKDTNTRDCSLVVVRASVIRLLSRFLRFTYFHVWAQIAAVGIGRRVEGRRLIIDFVQEPVEMADEIFLVYADVADGLFFEGQYRVV